MLIQWAPMKTRPDETRQERQRILSINKMGGGGGGLKADIYNQLVANESAIYIDGTRLIQTTKIFLLQKVGNQALINLSWSGKFPGAAGK